MSGADIEESVEAYAALEARLAAKSADRPAVFADAGLDVYAIARLRAHWDARFAGDPELESAYHERLAIGKAAVAAAPQGESAFAAAIPSYLRHPIGAAAALAPPPAPPAAYGPPPTPPAGPHDPDETLPVSGIPLGDLLPFRAQPSPAFEAALAAPRPAPASAREAPAEDDPNATSALPISATFTAESALPFKAPAPSEAPLPEWTPAQFASLQVELSLGTMSRAQVLARYSLDEATARRLTLAWQERMRRDSALRVRIQSLSEQYHKQLTSTHHA